MKQFPTILLSIVCLIFCGSSVYARDDHDHDHDHDHSPTVEHDHGDDCEHDHDAMAPITISPDMADKVGLTVKEAHGGKIEQRAMFPAEVLLNRDQVASVRPLYPSTIHELYAETGDEVSSGDRLAVLENRETLARYTVVAPRPGVITRKNASKGEIASEDTVLFEIADLSSVWVDISIFPQFRHDITRGQNVILVAADGHRMESSIHYISPLISRETRTIQARCVVANPDDDFMPGAFVKAHIAIKKTDARIRVEKAAVQKLDGETVVFVETGGGFIPREIRTGIVGAEYVEVLAGLAPGERYVVGGAFELKAHIVTSGLDPHAGHGH